MYLNIIDLLDTGIEKGLIVTWDVFEYQQNFGMAGKTIGLIVTWDVFECNQNDLQPQYDRD